MTHEPAGGLMYKMGQSNLQYVTSITFLLSTYAKYMMSSKYTFNCGNLRVTADMLRSLAKRQVHSSANENEFLHDSLYIFKLRLLISGGLHTGRKPKKDVIHGGLWKQFPKENSPQRFFIALLGEPSTSHWL